MKTPISLKIAKLLKEKGFDLNHKYMFFTSDETEKYPEEELSLKPTIAEVVMWLYEKHGIWTVVSTTISKQFIYKCIDMSGETSKRNYPTCVSKDGTYYNSPTEAYEAAIIYTLKNLI